MKNFSNNKFSKNNHKKDKQNSEYKKVSKFSNYSEDNNISRKENSFKNKHSKNQDFNKKLNPRNNNENKSFLKRRNNYKEPNIEPYSERNNQKKSSNGRNLDDWIWGKHSVFEVLTSDRAINRIWCTSEIFSSEKFYLLLKDLKLKGVLIEEVPWSRISQLTFGATHQGITVQLASSRTIPLERLINLSKINSTKPIILALDGITDPHNLGAIVRSAEAFDCKGIVLPQRRSAGLTGTVAKVAAGALEHIPVSRVVNLNRALEELKKNGFLTVGLSGDGNIPLSKFNEKTPLVVIVGSEDKGISLLTQKKCDYLLKIPLKGKTSSLNASVAAAISLFHLTSF